MRSRRIGRPLALVAFGAAAVLTLSVGHLRATTHTTTITETSDIGPGQATRQSEITTTAADDTLAYAFTIRLSESQGWWTPPIFVDGEVLAEAMTFEFRDETDTAFLPMRVRLITNDISASRDSIDVFLIGILPWQQVPDSAATAKRAIEIVRFWNTNPDTIAIVKGKKVR
ncbi:MAG: hypothetical protein A2V88_00700 [Elusimicrobia bacterium RBG_16_66_12]|nr:MAG: hypothetical protein A2V88_00700 [Elusimicrobia bacterium RBG_16_66_12]